MVPLGSVLPTHRDPKMTLVFRMVANLLVEPRQRLGPRCPALRVLRANLPWFDLMAGRGLGPRRHASECRAL